MRESEPAAPSIRSTLIGDIVDRALRRHSTATVLLHHAVAERLELGPTDHKCLDLLRERGSATGSALAAATGLTTGAITGVVARLERAGFVRRDPDPVDGRKQLLSVVPERLTDVHAALAPIRREMAELLEGFDSAQLETIARFLEGGTELAYRHAALLRAQALMPQEPSA